MDLIRSMAEKLVSLVGTVVQIINLINIFKKKENPLEIQEKTKQVGE